MALTMLVTPIRAHMMATLSVTSLIRSTGISFEPEVSPFIQQDSWTGEFCHIQIRLQMSGFLNLDIPLQMSYVY